MSHSASEKTFNRSIGEDKIWTKDFVFIMFSNFFIFLGFQMTLPTLPLFIYDLGGNDQLVGLFVGVFTFSALIFRPIAGISLDTKGRRFVYTLGLLIFVLSVGSYGFLPSLPLLFLLRIIQGIGWGYSTTASGTIATDLIPPHRRGEGMGYFGLSGNIALAIGPTLGLTLAGLLPFSSLFLLCAGLGFISFIFSSFITYKKVEKSNEQRKKWDIYEKSALPPSILVLFITVTFGGIASFLPIYAANKNIGGIELYFFLYAVSLLISRTFSGKIYDKKGHQAVFIPGALLIVFAMCLLAWLPNSVVLFIAGILYGLGFGTVQPALQAWSVKEVAVNRRGMANATFFSFFDLGIGLGAITFGQIAYLFGYGSIYLVSALSVVISILLYMIILKRMEKVKGN